MVTMVVVMVTAALVFIAGKITQRIDICDGIQVVVAAARATVLEKLSAQVLKDCKKRNSQLGAQDNTEV